ncbi:hypothetical protein R6Z07F_009649 [Ovis aries]
MKVAKSRDQLALQPLEGVDLSPEQDEGVLKFIKQEGPGMEMPKIGEVPLKATLVFEVELLEFKEEDLTDEEDRGSSGEYGGDGEGCAKPSDSATLEVALEGYFEDQIFDSRELSFEAATHTRGTRRRSLFNHLAGRSIWAVASSTPAHRAPEVDKVTEGRLVKAVQLGTVHAERLSLDGRVSQVSSSEETVFIPHLSAEPNTAASLLKIAFIVTTKKLLNVFWFAAAAKSRQLCPIL